MSLSNTLVSSSLIISIFLYHNVDPKFFKQSLAFNGYYSSSVVLAVLVEKKEVILSKQSSGWALGPSFHWLLTQIPLCQR